MADVKPFHVIFVIYNQYYKLLGTGFISLWNQWFCFFTYFGLYLGPQKGKSAKSADPDKTLQNAASDQSRHCLQIVYLQSNLNNSNTDGSFTMDNSNSFLSPYEILPIAQTNILRKFPYFIMKLYVLCTHENRLVARRCDSNEYTQHTIFVESWKYFPKLAICFLTWRHD